MMNTLKSAIANNLKFAREDAGLSQAEVAKQIGVTPQAISNYERGINGVDNVTLLRLCTAYGIGLDAIFQQNESIGQRLARIRANRGITLEQIGNAVGVVKSTVLKWETGAIENMGQDKVVRLAEFLQVTPGYLLGTDAADDGPEKDTVGARIRERRKTAGLSQAGLAARLGYESRSSINKIESGERGLPASAIKPMADALGITPMELMGWNEASDNGHRLGRTLRDARDREGLHVDELAAKLGKSRATVYRYESGDTDISVRQLAEYCAACGLELEIRLRPVTNETEE